MATKGRSAPAPGHILREAEAITGGAFALFLALSLVSFAPDAKTNLGGPVGQWLADTMLQAVGVAAYLFPVYLGYLTVALLRRNAEDFGALRFVGAAMLILALAAFAGLVTGGGRNVVHGGGWLGGFIGTVLHGFLGGIGAVLVLAMVVAFAAVLSTGMSAIDVSARAGRWLALHVRTIGEQVWTKLRARLRRGSAPAAEPRRARSASPKPIPLVEVDEDEVVPPRGAKPELPPIIREPEKRPEPPGSATSRSASRSRRSSSSRTTYRLPALTLLDAPARNTQPHRRGGAARELAHPRDEARRLRRRRARSSPSGPGPVITTFEFEPAPGVKVNRIVGLADDLAMALRALVGPHPGADSRASPWSASRCRTRAARRSSSATAAERRLPARPSRS